MRKKAIIIPTDTRIILLCTNIKNRFRRYFPSIESICPSRSPILANHDGIIQQLKAGVGTAFHPLFPSVHPESDITRIGIAIAHDGVGGVNLEADRLLQRLWGLTLNDRPRRCSPNMAARHPIRATPRKMHTDRIVNRYDVDEMAVASVRVKRRIAFKPRHRRMEIQVTRNQLISSTTCLNTNSVYSPIIERSTLKYEMCVIIQR